ncbi:MAG TPA: type II secretion system protein GspL [Anaeromyxobacteraceae bacterium]|nr:type II secretion system protein GspL [Anaeromyxobacteraceae bacterium]
MAQLILGLDLGAHAVKGVLLDSSYRGYVVLDAGAVPLAPAAAGEPLRDRQAAAVRALLAARGWRPDTVIVAFPGAAVASHGVTLPFTDPRRIEQTIGFEVEGQIPFDLADVAWDWQVIGQREGKTDLLVAVVRKEELAALLAALATAGVDPRAVVPAPIAYPALASAGALAQPPAPAPAAEPPPAGEAGPPGPEVEALVDLGHERTVICVHSGGTCEAARTFAFGSAQLARALARDLGIAEADAAALLAAEGGGSPAPEAVQALAADPRAADSLRRALVPLVRELRATLRAGRARAGTRPLRRLLVAGEAARLPGLPEVLAPELEGPVAPVALAGPAAERILPEAAPGLALALALALRGHEGSRAPRLNLRRGDLAYVRDFQHLKVRIERLAVYAALVLLLAIVSAGVRVFALSRQEHALDRALCDAETRIVGKCYPDYETAVAIMKGHGIPTASIPKTSAVDVFADLSERVPADVKLRFDRIEITREKLHVQGTTDSAESVDKVVSALRGSRCFGDARAAGIRKRGSDGKFEFSVDSALTCVDQPAPPGGGRG